MYHIKYICIYVCVYIYIILSRFVHNNNVIVLESRPGPVLTGCRLTTTRELCLRANPLCHRTWKKMHTLCRNRYNEHVVIFVI